MPFSLARECSTTLTSSSHYPQPSSSSLPHPQYPKDQPRSQSPTSKPNLNNQRRTPLPRPAQPFHPPTQTRRLRPRDPAAPRLPRPGPLPQPGRRRPVQATGREDGRQLQCQNRTVRCQFDRSRVLAGYQYEGGYVELGVFADQVPGL